MRKFWTNFNTLKSSILGNIVLKNVKELIINFMLCLYMKGLKLNPDTIMLTSKSNNSGIGSMTKKLPRLISNKFLGIISEGRLILSSSTPILSLFLKIQSHRHQLPTCWFISLLNKLLIC